MKLIAFLIALVLGVSVACSQTTQAEPPAARSVVGTDQALPTVTSVPTTPPAALGEVTLAAFDFIHDDFRTQVSGQVDVSDVQQNGVGRTIVVRLLNLSDASGSLNTRATINFNRGFDNYVEVPTNSGPLRLHLHRDNTLRTEPDNGSFT